MYIPTKRNIPTDDASLRRWQWSAPPYVRIPGTVPAPDAPHLPVDTVQRRNWGRVKKHTPEVEDRGLSVEAGVHAEAKRREFSGPKRQPRLRVVVPQLGDGLV